MKQDDVIILIFLWHVYFTEQKINLIHIKSDVPYIRICMSSYLHSLPKNQ
jgi:hypothetical protein